MRRALAITGLVVALTGAPATANAHESRKIGSGDITQKTAQHNDFSEATTRVYVTNFTKRTLKAVCVVRITSYWSRCCDNGYEENAFEASRRVGIGRVGPFKQKERTVSLTVGHPGMMSQGWEPSYVSTDTPHCHTRR